MWKPHAEQCIEECWHNKKMWAELAAIKISNQAIDSWEKLHVFQQNLDFHRPFQMKELRGHIKRFTRMKPVVQKERGGRGYSLSCHFRKYEAGGSSGWDSYVLPERGISLRNPTFTPGWSLSLLVTFLFLSNVLVNWRNWCISLPFCWVFFSMWICSFF